MMVLFQNRRISNHVSFLVWVCYSVVCTYLDFLLVGSPAPLDPIQLHGILPMNPEERLPDKCCNFISAISSPASFRNVFGARFRLFERQQVAGPVFFVEMMFLNLFILKDVGGAVSIAPLKINMLNPKLKVWKMFFPFKWVLFR